MTILSILFALASIHPGAHRAGSANALAAAVAATVDRANPVFGSPELDEAVLIDMAYHESTFRADARGDCGKGICLAFGIFQLQNVSPVDAFDVRIATRIAYARIRQSATDCPEFPLAMFAGGSCTNRGARKVSDVRMWDARRMVAEATP